MYTTIVKYPYSDDFVLINEFSKEDFDTKYAAEIEKYTNQYQQVISNVIKKNRIKAINIFTNYISLQYEELNNIDTNGISFDFERLRPKDIIIPAPMKPHINNLTERPRRSDAKYRRPLHWIQKLFISAIQKHFETIDTSYRLDTIEWLDYCNALQLENENNERDYNFSMKAYNKKIVQVKKEKQKINSIIDNFPENIIKGHVTSIETFINLLLDELILPLNFYKFSVTCDRTINDTLKIIVSLPSVDDMISMKSANTRDDNRPTVLEYSQAEMNRYYHLLVQHIIASLSNKIRLNIHLLSYGSYIINGAVKSKKSDDIVTTISTKVTKDKLMNANKQTVDQWFAKNKAYVGKKLSNHTALKEIY